MLKTDAAALGEALNGLAETFDKKPLGSKAVAIWFDTLREFPNELVRGILNTWPKLHGKFPTPAEVWKIVNDVQISEREQIARNAAKDARDPVRFATTDAGRRAMVQIRKLVRHPKVSPIVHWQRVEQRFKPGTISHEYATAALKILQRKRLREPGEDAEAA